jgi:membrane protein DedA with SNARE-associated domain
MRLQHSPARRWRRPLLVLAGLRYAIPLAALPLVPLLVPDRVALLTLLRPNKEILLLGGGLDTTQGSPVWLVALLAYLPLMVGGVWAFFGVGRAYAHELATGDGPRWLHRAVPQERLEQAQRVLARRGPAVAVLGRLAAMPPTVVAAAAGTSAVPTVRFLVSDLVGALAAFAATYGLGMALGSAYERGGVWLTAGGLALLVGAVVLMTRWLRAEAGRDAA